MYHILSVCFVFIGCCSNVYFLELLVSEYPGSGNIVTFSQFLFIALEGFIFTSKFGMKKAVVPFSYYVSMVSMFFIVQVVNNLAFNFNISMPLHMIFRSGSLAATLLLGIIILKRKYNLSKYISVGLISSGIIVCTIASAKQVETLPSHTGNATYDYLMWLIGISLLVFALFMSSRMGIFQEQTYAKYGKHPAEAMFYNHALPLPAFILMYKSIYSAAIYYNASAPLLIPVIGLTVPKLWMYLCLNER
ncbi:UDP-xylose and UDP-N-acetylglucosamine transporter isoform X2 [Patella vulgata]|uniref:UDP-xylose and UDP-N-acetylglucosamine transporter isoform X2 n=1 Tax=Patella vulgata TaxID=6465 RepID=UPI0021801F58|nr:UDP-xylose and UDP-N-acetylglucosamine transporter isoform X2 [Patella vulgata]